MKREDFEAKKDFAGTKKPSMLRRCLDHDYTNRQIYMITLVTEGRRPLFGRVTGKSDAQQGSDNEPKIILSLLGQRVAHEWWATAEHHPEISVIALQMMPDHLHGIIFVKRQMTQHLGLIIRGFKQSCNRHYRELISDTTQAGEVALATQHTQRATQSSPHGEKRSQGLLFAKGYNDKILTNVNQLNTWINYLADNPRRLLLRREHRSLLSLQHNLIIADMEFSAMGNSNLLNMPIIRQVQCSRSLNINQILAYLNELIIHARNGEVLISPAISQGEKLVMRAALNEKLPIILLQENGFTNLDKPGGAKRIQACTEGNLLILAPWAHHNERKRITRSQSLLLNDMARRICLCKPPRIKPK